MLLLTGSLIRSAYVYDTVSIDVECNLDLRYASGSRCDSVKNEASESCIAASHLALALKDMDLNRRLTVSSGRIDLALLYRNSRVAVDYTVKYAAESLNTERKRCNVEKKKILDLSAEYACLNCGADSNTFIGVDTLERLFSDKVLSSLLYGRNSCRSADKKYVIYL